MSHTVDSGAVQAPNDGLDPALSDERPAGARADLLRVLRRSRDKAELRQAVAEYLLIATAASAEPSKDVTACLEELLALRSADMAFQLMVGDMGGTLSELWRSVGRTGDILGPLFDASAERNWGMLRKLVTQRLEALCLTTPTLEAVDNLRIMLLNFGPQELPDFEEAVRLAIDNFLIKRPQQGARRVWKAYDSDGAEKAAEELARVTHHDATDPLSAARILQEAHGAILEILHPLTAPEAEFATLPVHSLSIFNALSRAADQAGRSPEAETAIGMIARALPHELLSEMIWHSVAEQGSAPTLSLEKICQLQRDGEIDLAELELRDALLPAVDRYYDFVRDTVQDFFELAANFLSPLFNWAPMMVHEERTACLRNLPSTWRRYAAHHPEEVVQIERGLARLEEQGFNLIRIGTVLQSYAPQFATLGLKEEIESRAEAFSDDEKAPELTLAVALSRSALLEAVRTANMDAMCGTPCLGELHFRLVSSGSIYRIRRAALGRLNPKSWFGLGPALPVRSFWRGSTARRSLVGVGHRDWPFSELGQRLAGLMELYARGALADSPLGNPERNTDQREAVLPPELLVICYLHGAADRSAAERFRLNARAFSSDGFPATQEPRRYWSQPTVPPSWSAAALIAATLLDRTPPQDRLRRSSDSEPYNKRFLIEAGLSPALANLLASNDRDGIGCAARLQAWCTMSGTPLEIVLEWLGRQKPEWVQDFVTNALLSIEADRRGEFPLVADGATVGGGNIAVAEEAAPLECCGPSDADTADDEPYQKIIAARTITGIGEWARATGRPMPEKPRRLAC